MTHPLHIVFLTQWYPHPEDKQNGVFIRHQAEGLAKKHCVTVCWVGASETNKRLVVSERLKKDGYLREVIVRYPKTFKAIGKSLAWKKALDRIKKMDVVHLNVLDRDFLLWELWLKSVRRPYIIHEHASLYFRNYRHDAIWHPGRKRLIRNAFCVCPVSHELKHAMLKQSLRGKYVIVPNILKVPKSLPRKKRPEVLRMVSVGDLVNEVKRFHQILKALEHVPGPWEYHVIGGGPDRHALEYMSAALFAGDATRRVFFHGRKKQSEVQLMLPGFHVCLINSRFETFGLVALEALNAGVPVLSPPVGVTPQYLREGQNGYLLEHPSGFPKMIQRLWDSYDSLDKDLLAPEERSSLSARSYRTNIELMYRQLGLLD